MAVVTKRDMGSSSVTMAVVAAAVAVLILFCDIAQAQAPVTAPAPAIPSDDCLDSLANNLGNCLTFVEKGSNLTKPETGCCSGLAKLVATNPTCLCRVLHNSTDSIGLEVDVKKAINLPKVCRVTTPSFTLCADIGYPVSGLPPSPSPSPGPGPGPSGSDNGGSTLLAPQVMNPKSSAGRIMDGTSIKFLVVTLLFGLLSTVTLAIF
ncbi:hypothetical protein Syun_031190 [Stephania yunnanensis]|uniref:Bifunctional inhibitor/plant lipid transfer protein/seed storage helical domain-containing protein n=1 Tax=Stephania yunnanensis TaxID=152371 RepID=A0AAP0E2V5_9MAGN